MHQSGVSRIHSVSVLKADCALLGLSVGADEDRGAHFPKELSQGHENLTPILFHLL